MPNVRVLPPDATPITTVVNSRAYTTTGGTPLDVPDFDALILKANSWHISEAAGVGASSARPLSPNRGQRFADTTLGISISWDGRAWRNTITGAVV